MLVIYRIIDAMASGSHINAKSCDESPHPRQRNDDWSMPYNPSVEICVARSAAMPEVTHGNFKMRKAINSERGKKQSRR